MNVTAALFFLLLVVVASAASRPAARPAAADDDDDDDLLDVIGAVQVVQPPPPPALRPIVVPRPSPHAVGAYRPPLVLLPSEETIRSYVTRPLVFATLLIVLVAALSALTRSLYRQCRAS